MYKVTFEHPEIHDYKLAQWLKDKLATWRAKKRTKPTKSEETEKEKVSKVMHEWKAGTLKSGGSGKTVTNRKQAIAIALSEARRAGADIPATAHELWTEAVRRYEGREHA